jgi:hypothetical protein
LTKEKIKRRRRRKVKLTGEKKGLKSEALRRTK